MIRLIKQLVKRQRGGLLLPGALITLVFSAVIVLPFLSSVQGHSRASQIGADGLTNLTYGTAAIEHALWRLQYEGDFTDVLSPSSPTLVYDVIIEENAVPVSITAEYPEGYSEPGPYEPGPGQKRLNVTKAVTPETALAGFPTTFTYTVTFDNIGPQNFTLSRIEDQLPPGLSYVSSSTSGVTTDDPEEEFRNGKSFLLWTPNESVPSGGGSATLYFQAQGTLAAGSYYTTI